MVDSNPLLVITVKVEARMAVTSMLLTYIATLVSEKEWEREIQTIVPILPRSTLVAPRNAKIPLIVPN